MLFKQWLLSEYGPSADYKSQIWYQGTNAFDKVVSSGKLLTRAEGAKRVNAAAMGLGIYLTNDLEEAKSYVFQGIPGGIVSVQIVGNPKLMRLHNTPEDNEFFEWLRQLGLGERDNERGSPEKVNNYLELLGYHGVHWDSKSGEQKIVVYRSSDLGPITPVLRSVPIPGMLLSRWEKVNNVAANQESVLSIRRQPSSDKHQSGH